MAKWKRAMSLLLVITMVVSVWRMPAYATPLESMSQEGLESVTGETKDFEVYQDYQYEVLEDGTIAICGYVGQEKYLEIPSEIAGAEVTKINQEAFAYNSDLEGIVIPKTVKEVGNAAFHHCENLKVIVFLGEMLGTGITVAEGCKQLEKVVVLNSCDISMFCSLLISDMGEEKAKEIEILELETIAEIEKEYQTYSGVKIKNQAIYADEVSVEIIAEGVCGDNLTWQLKSDGELVISGTGEMYNVGSGSAPWYPHKEKITSLKLDEGITTIGDYAFSACKELKGTLTIPDSVTSIGRSAFYNCAGFTGIEIGTGLQEIGAYAFYRCDGFTGKLTIPDQVTVIGSNAFTGCGGLNKLELGNGVMKIEVSAFFNCSGFTGDLMIPDSVTSIDSSAFSGCSGLDGTLKLSENLTTISENTFYGCRNLSGELTIPDKVTRIDSYAFRENEKITSVVFGENLRSVYYDAFYGCKNITELTFIGLSVPSRSKMFSYMEKLETIYVPREALGAYKEAFRSVLPEGVIIKSIGATGDFQIDDGVLTAYFGEGGEVVIPDSVEAIGAAAFQNCTTLTKVIIPSSVKRIEQYAFNRCSQLTEISIPDSVESIGNNAFEGCKVLSKLTLGTGLKSIGNNTFYNCAQIGGKLIIPDSVTSIGQGAFYGCTRFTGIEIGTGLQTIAPHTFYGCSGFTGELIIPDQVITISDYAFNGCRGLNKLNLGNGVTNIGSYAFQNCTGFTGDLMIPSSVTSIGESAFSGCSGLNRLNLGNGVTNIGSYAFQYCTGFKGDLIISDSVIDIGSSAFSGCSGLDGTLKLSENLTSISANTFNGCRNLSGELVIPEKITLIGDASFRGCGQFTSIMFGGKLTRIDYNAFYECNEVREITFNGLEVPQGLVYVCSLQKLETVYVPGGALRAYKEAFQSILPEGVTVKSIGATEDFQIDDGVLTAYFGDGGEVIIPDSVEVIGAAAFQNCTTLTKIIIPSSVKRIEQYAFNGCSQLTEISIPDSVESIGNNAFESCERLGKLKLGNSLRSIGIRAFYNCVKLSGTLTIPDSVTSVGQEAFYNCAGFTGIEMGTGLQTIDYGTFRGCIGLTGDLVIPDQVTMISDYAFYECRGLNKLNLGNGVTNIGSYAFQYCTGFKGDLIIPDSVIDIGSSAFSECSGLDGKLKLSENLTSISANIFNGCRNLSGELVIPKKITVIGDAAFRGCGQFTLIVFGEDLAEIGWSAFSDCNEVREITFNGLAVPQGLSYICSSLKLETIYVPGEALGAYKEAFQSILPEGVAIKSIGVTEDFQIDDGVLTAYFGDGGEVIIPDSVEVIGAAAFQNCTTLIKIIIPSNVKHIEQYAFNGCSQLTEISIPDSVESIGNNAFESCERVEKFKLGNGLRSIGIRAFSNCAKISGTLTIPDSVTSVGQEAFYGCAGFTGIKIGTGLQTIDYGTFRGCIGLTGELVIPDQVTTISDYAFYECSGLNKLNLGNGVTNIGSYAFQYCTGFKGDLIIPDSVIDIGSSAFSECSGLDGKLKLSENLTSISANIFNGCRNLSGELVIPKKITVIGDAAFRGCGQFTLVVFGEDLAEIGWSAFSDCNEVREITFNGLAVPQGLSYVCSSPKLDTIYVPRGALGAYKKAFQSILPEGVTIKSIGATGDFQIDDGVLTAYFGDGGEAVIPDSVEVIGAAAFQNCTTLTKVIIPSSVKRIESFAFNDCNQLTEIRIPNSVESIGNNAFEGCEVLSKLTLGNGLKSIGMRTFCNCAKLSGTLTIPDSVTSIGQEAFYGCAGFTGIEIGTGLQMIDYGTFRGCIGLTGDLVIPDQVTMISDYAFYECRGLNKLNLGNGVMNIGSYAFQYCTGFKGDLIIPDSVIDIGSSAFSECSGLDGKLKLSENLTSISTNIFNGCRNLSGELVIPEKITVIGDAAFRGCGQFTLIVFGKDLAEIGWSAFSDCNEVREITFNGLAVPQGLSYVCSSPKLETIYVPRGALGAYKKAFQSILPEGVIVKSIGATGDFQIDDGVLTAYFGDGGEIVIPDSVETIGAAAFQNCTTLTKVIIPSSVKRIESYAFNRCSQLTEISIPDSLESIGNNAFEGCKVLSKLTLGVGLNSIGMRAFYNCAKISGTLTIPDSVTSIGQEAFYNCAGFTGIEIGTGLQTIAPHTFYGCTGFTGELIIPDQVTMISDYAFYECRGLNKLNLGNGVTNIGSYAFQSCTGFKGDLRVPDSVVRLGRETFSGCSGLDGTLKLSENLTEIGYGTFQSCTNISGEIVIPDKVTIIGEYAFGGNEHITSIVFGENLQSIYYNAFYNSVNVTELTFTGLSVPGQSSLFSYMEKLETIYVPQQSYDAYVAAYSGSVGENVKFVSDMLRAKVKNLIIKNQYSKSVVLAWNKHISEEVIGYKIERDGVLVGDTAECEFTERNLETGTRYEYVVYGYTEDGRTTRAANVSVILSKPNIVDIKTDNIFNKIGLSKNSIYIYVTNNDNFSPLGDDRTVGTLYYMKDGKRERIAEAELTTKGNQISVVYEAKWDISNVEEGNYEVIFCLTDVDGTTVEYSENIIVDHSVPAQIIGVSAVSDVDVIHLSWLMSTEVDTDVYRIYRRAETDETFRLIAQISDRETLTYTDRNVRKDHVYYYFVVGVNDFGQESIPSRIVGATLSIDDEAPVVTKITPQNGSYLSGKVTVALESEDNVSVIKSELYYKTEQGDRWELFARGDSEAVKGELDTVNIPDGIIEIQGIAYDAAGNASSALTQTYKIDNTGPEKIQGVEGTTTSVNVTLSWNDVSDNDIGFFVVEQKKADGTYKKVAEVSKVLGVNLLDLKPDTEYTYRVTGYDIHGNRGTPSDDITVRTMSDTTAPVITKINPKSGHYSETIDLSISAEDDDQIEKVVIQTSPDMKSWKDVYTKSFEEAKKQRTISYKLSLETYAEGEIYVRAIATDGAGNESDSSLKAPFVQHMVDRTAPASPQNIVAKGENSYIEIKWDSAEDIDVSGYCLYRAQEADGTYEKVQENIAALNYFDRSVADEKTYFYKVAAVDLAGNQSGYSEVVSAQISEDQENPVIQSIYPETGSRIGPNENIIRVLASDNRGLQSVEVEYSKDGNSYVSLRKETIFDTYYKNIALKAPLEQLEGGQTLYVRASALDKAGNASEIKTAEYMVDKTPPTVAEAAAVFEDENVVINWVGNQEEDLYGYRIYRKTGADGNYSLIAQCEKNKEENQYSYVDSSISKEEVSYIYKIEAVDYCDNSSYLETDEIHLPDRNKPNPVISCDSIMEVGVEYVIDASESTDDSGIAAYRIDFGDGTVSNERCTKHIYSTVGDYEITLTVVDVNGNESTTFKKIRVKERALIGKARIRVVDENGNAVPSAPVYFDLGSENQVIKRTDQTGHVEFTADVGKHTIGAVIANNEWLPAKKDIIVRAGVTTTVSLTMVHHVMIQGDFEITRMTLDEIKAAGIDISDPENQYIVQVNMKLTYGEESVPVSFTYNESTGKVDSKPIFIDTDDGKRELIPNVIGPRPDFISGEGGYGDYEFSEECAVAFLDIPVEVSSLKEFFDVNLHIVNYSSEEFSMLENRIKLNVPDGLSIMDTYKTEGKDTVELAEIKGQTTETLTWILRGDEVGEYYVSADYSGILEKFNEPITSKFIAKEPIKVYGMSNLRMIIEIPAELDHGTLYYNVALSNEGELDIYRPNISTPDTLIETQLYDEKGSNIIDEVMLTPEEGHKLGVGTTITGDLDILKPRHRLVKHYMSIDQTIYTEAKQKLQEYAYEVGNTYGLEIEFVERPLSYFKGNLSASINAVEKAEQTFKENKSAFEYLMTNENYIYWSMYASTGAVESALTTNAQEFFWDLLSVAGGSGGFDSLFGADDDKLIQAIILDTMEISAEANDFSKFEKVCDWTKIVTDWIKKQGYGEWADVVAKWLLKNASKFTKEQFEKMGDVLGESLPRTFELIAAEYKWETYKAVYEGEYLDFDNFIISKWKVVIEEEYFESVEVFEETDWSEMLHSVFSKEGFKQVWNGIGIGLDISEKIINVCKETTADVSLFIAAQSNLDNCNLFLDTIVDFTPTDKGDAKKVVKEAKVIRDKINELDPMESVLEHGMDEAFWAGVGYVKDKVFEKLMSSASGIVQAVKIALKLTTFIGNSVFNVDDRHDIADNIRFVSHMTRGMRSGIWNAQAKFLADGTEESAQEYMQLISYMLNLRAIGESQVAAFGMTYEVLEGVFDSKELFLAVREMSGADEANTWIEWRDFVEDKISLIRIELLRNPVATDVSDMTAPVVTFDYASGKTAQIFSDEYEYSLDRGKHWTACTGTPIEVAQQFYSTELQVRRVDRNSSGEKLTGSVMIYAPSSLNGIKASETEDGYCLEGLNPDKNYEVTFSETPLEYAYEEALQTAIPRGSYSYKIQTDAAYRYVYVRTIADAMSYASYVCEQKIPVMSEITVQQEGQGIVEGTGKYQPGETVTLVAVETERYKFAGWYENGTLLSLEPVFSFEAAEDRTIVAKFTKKSEDWVVDSEENFMTGVSEKTSVEEVLEYFHSLGQNVEVTDAAGNPTDKVGTGCIVILDGKEYTVVVSGDVNGDAEIDIYDVYRMWDHLQSETSLEGAYFEAGCVCQDDAIDQEELNSVLEYINTGKFADGRTR